METTYDTVDDIDTGIATEAFLDPVLAEFRNQGEAQHWQDELVASRKEREKFFKRGIETIKRYSDDRDSEAKASNYNVFFANTETKLATVYARTPEPDIKRRFNDANDEVSRVASNILQRCISIELECEDFSAKFKQMLFDRLVPGIGIGWARLEQEEGEYDYDALTGLPVPQSNIKHQCADIDYVPWDDFLWAPCRTWQACRWVARRVPMSKPAIKDRFAQSADPMVLKNLTFSLPSTSAPVDSAHSLQPKNVTEPTADVYEIWDKERKLVFWVVEGVEEPFDVQQDQNEFPGFFPTPLPPLCRTTTSSTTPISDFSLVQDLYNELDNLNNRCSKLVAALQLKFVYDAKNTELKGLFTTTKELEGLGVKDWSMLQGENGGIRSAIEFVPLEPIANTYQKLVQARDMVKQQIYEIEGISDFLRGVQQPYVSASAANATASASSSRLTTMQNEVADYIQRLLRLQAHLICKFYTSQTIMENAGSLPAADQQYAQQAIALLQNEQMRYLRLEVSVDSIQQANWNQEKADKNELAHSITALLSQIVPAAQANPGILPLGVSLMQFMISGYKGAKDLEGTLDAAMQQLTSQAAQKSQQPPPPTPEQTKANLAQQQMQADAQIAQSKNQTALQIAGMQQQSKSEDNQVRMIEAQTHADQVKQDAARDQQKVHIDIVNGAHQQAMDRITPLSPGGL